MSNASDSELAGYIRRESKLRDGFMHGNRDRRRILHEMQRLAEGRYPEPDGPERFKGLLLPIEQQVERLTRYDQLYWHGALSGMLGRNWPQGENQQEMWRVRHLHVEFQTPERTWEMWRRVFEGTHARMKLGRNFQAPNSQLRLHPQARRHHFGIHPVTMALVPQRWPAAADWHMHDPAQSVEMCRGQEAAALPASELLSFFGLHTELTTSMDGRNMPYIYLPGYEVDAPALPGANVSEWDQDEGAEDEPWQDTLALSWYIQSGPMFHPVWKGDRCKAYACPLIVE